MRVLAVDHGSKRMGLALSDELGMLAHPIGFLDAEPLNVFFGQLRSLVVEKEIGLILVGLPRNMDGSYGPAALRVQEFVAVLRSALAVPIQTWDERLTSTQAHRQLREAGARGRERRQKVDAAAAAVLLQSYLDAQQARQA